MLAKGHVSGCFTIGKEDIMNVKRVTRLTHVGHTYQIDGDGYIPRAFLRFCKECFQ